MKELQEDAVLEAIDVHSFRDFWEDLVKEQELLFDQILKTDQEDG